MEYFAQATHEHVQKLTQESLAETEKYEVAKDYLNELADNNTFSPTFFNVLIFDTFLGQDAADEAEALLYKLAHQVIDSAVNMSADNTGLTGRQRLDKALIHFKDRIDSLCERIADQVVESKDDVFGIIDRYTEFAENVDLDEFDEV